MPTSMAGRTPASDPRHLVVLIGDTEVGDLAHRRFEGDILAFFRDAACRLAPEERGGERRIAAKEPRDARA